ncbi:hypothetical protein MAM1_0562c10922 [Mucor ambiguus]|uniref:Uncharacterized protein n=1 Tax=Mucor ambiguus TaxID=91626 RepID=A0A0C9N9G0_9FUNG|nr:hypothetical protein MAM1_0562c10922 [Mucor ambiguus]
MQIDVRNASTIQSVMRLVYLANEIGYKLHVHWFDVQCLGLELVLLDVPVGHAMDRVSHSEWYEFPNTIKTFALDFLPLWRQRGKENKL